MAINDFFVWGSGGEKLTPEQVKRQQMQAQALQQAGADFSPAGHWTEALGRGLSGFMGGLQDRRARDAESAGIASANEAFNNAGIAELLMGDGSSPQFGGVTTPQVGGGAAQTPLPQSTASGAGGSFLSAIDRTEGGGNYDTLFGHAQKGGQFGNVRVSQMPISEVIAFASPSGQYGQSVKGKVGHVATPMGRYQIVGSTLKQAAKEMGLDPNTPFSPQVQDAMATHIAQKAIAGKSDSQAINALRNTWEGFKSVPDSQMVSILGELRGSKAPSAGVQVASADPNFMPDVASREIPLTALQPSPVVEALATQPQQPQATAAPASQPNPVSEALLSQHDKAFGGALALDAGAGTGQQAGFPQPPQQRSAPNMAAILQLANNPYLNDTQRTILGSVLQQQMQANDPLRALQMQQAQQGLTKGELEIAAMQSPQKKPIEVGGVLLNPDTYEPIFDSRTPSDGGFTLSEGQQRFDASGNPIASVAPKVDPDQYETQRIKMPDGSEVMVERRKGTNDPWQASQIPQGGTTGTGASIRLTEGQSKDTVYSTRAAGALPVIDSLGEYLTNPFERAKEYDPTGLIRGTQSPEYQQAKNAGDEFLQAILRKDTGAAIAKEEMSSYGSVYLPMPGDSKEVLEQKREARSRALNAMQAGMPPEAILAQERALKKTNDKTSKSKPISEMTDAELEAIANGN